MSSSSERPITARNEGNGDCGGSRTVQRRPRKRQAAVLALVIPCSHGGTERAESAPKPIHVRARVSFVRTWRWGLGPVGSGSCSVGDTACRCAWPWVQVARARAVERAAGLGGNDPLGWSGPASSQLFCITRLKIETLVLIIWQNHITLHGRISGLLAINFKGRFSQSGLFFCPQAEASRIRPGPWRSGAGRRGPIRGHPGPH